MKIDKLKKKLKDVFKAEEAEALGVSRQLLKHYVRIGLIDKTAHGFYRFTGTSTIDFTEIIKEKLIIVPTAIVGLKTALQLHDLTDELDHQIHLIVPKENVPKIKIEDVVFHRYKGDIYRKDIIKINKIPVTSLERTIVDLLKEDFSIAFILKIIESAKQKNKIISISKLKKLAVIFRTNIKLKLLLGAWFE
jgi:predicted transcriptional regulator of viral defense system